MSDESSVDLLIHWKESGSLRDAGRDSVSVAHEGDEQAETATRGLDADVDPGALWAVDEVPPEDEKGPEYFEWSADREQALEEALEQTFEGAVPRVHSQLQAIAQGLEGGSLSEERARELLTEVERYLAGRIAGEQGKVPVADQSFAQSRADKLNALFAWQEAAAALRQYLEHGEAVQLKVAYYAAEQANGFLTAARDLLLEIEPEPEPDSDSDRDEEAAPEAS